MSISLGTLEKRYGMSLQVPWVLGSAATEVLWQALISYKTLEPRELSQELSQQ